MTTVLAIDPGAKGAICLLDDRTRVLAVHDMPVHAVTINKRTRNRIDLHGLNQLIKDLAVHAELAVIEEVGANPNDGVLGAFSFGEAFGAVKMAVAAHEIPLQLCRPQEWKAFHRLIGKDKDDSRQKASQLLPEHARHWARKMDDGRAEAALLALYGAHILKGKP